jgi:hypothetical protein
MKKYYFFFALLSALIAVKPTIAMDHHVCDPTKGLYAFHVSTPEGLGKLLNTEIPGLDQMCGPHYFTGKPIYIEFAKIFGAHITIPKYQEKPKKTHYRCCRGCFRYPWLSNR